MLTFKYKDYTINDVIPAFKHHKQAAFLVLTEYDDENRENRGDAELVKKYPERITSNRVSLFDFDTYESFGATQHHILLDNTDYKERYEGAYYTTASNTSQKTSIRIYFTLDENHFVFDYTYESAGSYASTLYDIFSDSDSIFEMFQDEIERVEKEKKDPLVEIGIRNSQDPDLKSHFEILSLNENKQLKQFDISERELRESFVGLEIYEYKMKIDGEDVDE